VPLSGLTVPLHQRAPRDEGDPCNASPMPDPDLTAVLLTLAVAGGLGLRSKLSGLRRRRSSGRFCDLCGRVLVLGEKTCDCSRRPK
jgi:hypothetical protein